MTDLYPPVDNLENLPADLQERIRDVEEKLGFVPNVFTVLARRPAELSAFLAYHDALMEKESGLTKVEREMIVVVTSAANSCLYCVVAHGAILRIRSKDPELSDRLTINWRDAPITDRQQAMLEFAVKLARTPEYVSQTDHDRLLREGFTEEDIWDIGAITALFALSNRMAHLTGMEPNPEFFTLGR